MTVFTKMKCSTDQRMESITDRDSVGQRGNFGSTLSGMLKPNPHQGRRMSVNFEEF